MAVRNRSHILLRGRATSEAYRPPPRKIDAVEWARPADPRRHVRGLEIQLASAAREGVDRRIERTPIAGAVSGFYLVFESFPDIELALESLDPRVGRVHPELVSVQEVVVNGTVIVQATVFVPDGQVSYFVRRLDEYGESVDRDNPRNRNLIDRISSIRLATIAQLWTDVSEDFPSPDEAIWWEAWLRRRDGGEVVRLRNYAEHAQLLVGTRTITFPDRVVALVHGSPRQLASILDALDDLAELRAARSLPQMLASDVSFEQADWIEELRLRTVPAEPGSPTVCILDTGVHRDHPLLATSLESQDCHAVEPDWRPVDHHGHGTEMAGLALYGDFGASLEGGGPVRLPHRLESVKILPPVGANPPELYGAVTGSAVSRVEAQAGTRRRVFSLAVTAAADAPVDGQHDLAVGQPSSWSAALDAIATGFGVVADTAGDTFLDEDTEAARRLFLVSAGNIDAFEDDYLSRCDLEPVEEPAQAWNVVTVGSFTELVAIDPGEVGFEGWTPLAGHGQLSPYSRTSVAFDRSWPVKPDIVVEGGNVARSPDGSAFDWPDSYQVLTTKRPVPDPRLLTLSRQTSASTAQAAHIAASILAQYPNIWPETLRALLIHSAEWTPAMKAALDAAQLRQPRDAVRRRFGMGVPSLERATRSAGDALTLVTEDIIRPFDGTGRMREMHLHDLPWPRDVLAELGVLR